MWPPATEIASLAARMRGPLILPALMRSRASESTLPTPPTVRIVVTPLISWVRA